MGFLCTSRRLRARPRAGIILVGALWVMAFLALIVVSFVASQEVELKVTGNFADRVQARHLAASGIDLARADLLADETPDFDGPGEAWMDDPERYDRVPLGEGFFTLLTHDPAKTGEPAYGVEDLNRRINLNTAPKEVLQELPGMTEALAEAVVDWRDEDDEVTGEGGAESDTYVRLDPPYEAKNGPFDTVEELLMVKGFTLALVFGEDANRNGVLDPNEDDGDESWPSDDRDGELDGGLADLLTVFSYESNTGPQGQPRVNINTATMEELRNRLGEVLPDPKLQWIAEYRKVKVGGEPLFPDEQYATPANVVAVVPVPGVAGQPLTFEEYRQVAHLLTVTDDAKLEGRTNVNTAPEAVLLALPQLTEEEVDAILAERGKEEADLASPTWVFDVLEGTEPEKVAKYQALEPFIGTRSGQFAIQAVGVVPGRGAFARILAVFDRAAETPRFLYWKEISGLGAAFPPPTREEWEDTAGETNR